jgi:Leucine-rich repeat (LRR) protein
MVVDSTERDQVSTVNSQHINNASTTNNNGVCLSRDSLRRNMVESDDYSPDMPYSLADEYAKVVSDLESLETEERVRSLPRLTQRAAPLEIGDLEHARQNREDHTVGVSTSQADDPDQYSHCASLCRRDLKAFSISMLPQQNNLYLSVITKLDVGNNELSDLPGLSSLPNLAELILTRNWFGALPVEIGALSKLRRIDASRNFLRPTENSLQFSVLRTLVDLRILDLSYNQKCGKEFHVDRIKLEVPQLTDVQMTMWEKISSTPGAYVGSSAAERDATLLRSQLEPWGTVQLRRRLVSDFGREPTNPAVVSRADVMAMLLEAYRQEGLVADDNGNGT